MNRVRKRYILLLLMVAIFVGVLVAYLDMRRINQRYFDFFSTDAWKDMSPDEHRALAHRVLRYPVGNHHDAFISLGQVGNHDSIPILIGALKWQPRPSPDGTMICTTGHCLDALTKLTGEDHGTSYLDWKIWWITEGSK